MLVSKLLQPGGRPVYVLETREAGSFDALGLSFKW